MSLLAAVNQPTEVVEEEQDVLGGGGLLESGLYQAMIEVGYLTKADSGALALNLRAKIGDRNYTESIYFQSGDKKGNKTTFTTSDGETKNLPGFTVVTALARLAAELNSFGDFTSELKTIGIYDFESKKEIPTEVEILSELTGKPVLLGIQKIKENKTKKGDDDVYRPTNDVRETNTIAKVFRASDRKTTAEILGDQEATFADRWEEKWSGQTVDKFKEVKGGAAAGGNAGTAKPTTSLFAAK